MILKKLLELFTGWARSQKTKMAERAAQEIREVARLGQNLVVMELK